MSPLSVCTLNVPLPLPVCKGACLIVTSMLPDGGITKIGSFPCKGERDSSIVSPSTCMISSNRSTLFWTSASVSRIIFCILATLSFRLSCSFRFSSSMSSLSFLSNFSFAAINLSFNSSMRCVTYLIFSSCFSMSPLLFSNISLATSKFCCITLSSCFVLPYEIPSVYTCTLSLVIKYTLNGFSASKLLTVKFFVVGHPTCAFSKRNTDGCKFKLNSLNFFLDIGLKFRGFHTSWVVFAPSGNTNGSSLLLLFSGDDEDKEEAPTAPISSSSTPSTDAKLSFTPPVVSIASLPIGPHDDSKNIDETQSVAAKKNKVIKAKNTDDTFELISRFILFPYSQRRSVHIIGLR
mmetsp:Transcript_1510/g.5530  ORF Transcript_1510/g.5530 Transcript_1510/m.5530 type:complete len:349 (-) Transcript_1510:152-1198(-)